MLDLIGTPVDGLGSDLIEVGGVAHSLEMISYLNDLGSNQSKAVNYEAHKDEQIYLVFLSLIHI